MKKMFFAASMLVFAMCIAAAAGAKAQDTMPSSGGGAMKSDNKKTGGKTMNPDAKFMMMAATSDMNEISLSNVALQKSSNDDVKKFAQMMIDDHTKSSDMLKPIAMSKNVTLPSSPDAKHQAAMTKLQAMSGAMFDKEYIKMMVKDHQKAVAMFQKESTGGKDADAKAFASTTLPVIQGHLTMAQSMNGKMMNMKMSDGKMSGM